VFISCLWTGATSRHKQRTRQWVAVTPPVPSRLLRWPHAHEGNVASGYEIGSTRRDGAGWPPPSHGIVRTQVAPPGSGARQRWSTGYDGKILSPDRGCERLDSCCLAPTDRNSCMSECFQVHGDETTNECSGAVERR
jgi:hypothetical protein